MRIPLTYNIRSMWQRRLSTTLTVGGISLVVFMFAAVLMLANGLEQTLAVTGSDHNAIVLRKSSSTEVMSSISRENTNLLRSFSNIDKHPETSKPLFSPEAVTIINLPKMGATTEIGNVTVRGVTPDGLHLRSQINMVQGKIFRPGSYELVVGKSISSRFANCKIDDFIEFGNQKWKVVGVFESRGAAFECELWTDAEPLMTSFGRPYFSSITLRLKSPTDFDAMKEMIEKDRRLEQVEIKREKKYYEEQSASLATFIRVLGMVITIIFSLAAMIGAMITMYSAVANRTNIIGTLRILGFQRQSVLVAFLVEAVIISGLGGLIGVGMAFFLKYVSVSTLNFGTFTETTFSFQLSPNIVANSLVFAIFMGVIGGFLPAVRAARLKIINALRGV